MELIPLTDAIAELRRELGKAVEVADGPVSFDVENIELELAVEVTKTGGGRVGFSVGVVGADGNASAAKTRHHRVKLSLTPKIDNGSGQSTMRLSGAIPE